MEKLKEKILSGITGYSKDNECWHSIDEFEGLVYEKDGYKIYNKAIEEALKKYKCIKVSKRDCIYIERPIILESGYRLLFDREQKISNIPGTSF